MAVTVRDEESPSPLDGAAAPPGIRLPGILLGIGLGGFVDGIVLHQMLQWHHMLASTDTDRVGIDAYPTDTVRGLEVNTLWDGVFHLLAWLAVLVGLRLLYTRMATPRRRVWSSKTLWGLVLVGWGLFNLVEGVVDHHLLGIHHVKSGPNQTVFDLAFLAFGAALILVGSMLHHAGEAQAAADAELGAAVRT